MNITILTLFDFRTFWLFKINFYIIVSKFDCTVFEYNLNKNLKSSFVLKCTKIIEYRNFSRIVEQLSIVKSSFKRVLFWKKKFTFF